MFKAHLITRHLFARAWCPPAASTFSIPVFASVSSPAWDSMCRWPRQHRYSKQPASSAITGGSWLSCSTLTSEKSQAALVSAAAAGRHINRGVVTSSTDGLKSPTPRSGGLRASSAAASEHEQTEIRTGDHLALLDLLGLTEIDVLPKMSKRNQAFLGDGQDRESLEGLGGEAAYFR